jgi:hypothetical protein
LAISTAGAVGADQPPLDASAVVTLRKYCLDCHGEDLAEARVNLDQMTKQPDFGRGFREWEKAIGMLRQNKMPPKDAPQPTREERMAAISGIEQALAAYISKNAGDPGSVVLRRLTSAEYGYTIDDLTGLELKLGRRFVSDAVGGEGFTNVGSAQFVQDSTLEEYLSAAKSVADHAVIGAGPLSFFEHPGQSGRELSAIHRIQQLYRRTGFRTAAGEGAEPFGLDLYPRALLVAWRFRHRAALGPADATLEQLARDEGLSVRLCEHIWSVLDRRPKSFPLSAIVQQWQALPEPEAGRPAADDIRAACDKIGSELRQWQSVLSAASGDEEEAAVLTEGTVQIKPRHVMEADIDWPDGAPVADLELSVATASQRPAAGALVVWRNPRIRFVREDNRRAEIISLISVLTQETAERLRLGRHPAEAAIGKNDFVLTGESNVAVRLDVPEGMIAARLFIEVELDTKRGADAIVRCRIADGAVAGETAAEVGDTSTLLGDPASPHTAAWQAGVAEFARLLPEVSHREPTPSDRDPIPTPYDNTYNMPERNHFHAAIKYHRDDRFLVSHVLDDPTQIELDQAWTDLLTSCDYHDANLRFIATKYKIDLGGKTIASLRPEDIERMPLEPRGFIRRLRSEHASMHQALQAAEPVHVDDAVRFAVRAWRRPLSKDEEQRLREFYQTLLADGVDHTKAIRSLLARILVAPAFLYRYETSRSATEPAGVAPLSDWELASRLSYFLWSTQPDEELLRAAAAGKLQVPENLAQQTRRMAKDPKARRMATEFFGQWLGFYRFDEYRGIDANKFPEFNDALKTAMHGEAVAFFEYIIRENRPASEMLTADYTFLSAPLARHYGITAPDAPDDRFVRVANLTEQNRGGLLGLGAVLASTSAPLRTSAVKRGDWVLRRLIGTPVPPPPADAGSIPPDDALTDGLTVRQRLEAHRTDRSCVNCHSRIDPLGFALENFDPLGRWREKYDGGRPIDASGILDGGTEISGLEGLRDYLRRQQPQFERNLCGKLLGYALGRSELASDRPLIDEMLADLKDQRGFQELIVRIVCSQQFRYRRCDP